MDKANKSASVGFCGASAVVNSGHAYLIPEFGVEAAYMDVEEGRVFYHTLTPEKLRGQGLASCLIKHAFVDTVKAGKKIIPMCPFAVWYMDQHPDNDWSEV